MQSVYLYYSVNLMSTLLLEIPFLPRARCQTNTTTIQTSQLQALKTAQTQHPHLIISTWFVQSYTTSYKRPQGTRCSQRWRPRASVLMVVKCNHHKASAIRHWGCLATFTPLMSTEAITCSVCPCSQSYWVLFFSTDGENTMKNIVY